MKGSITILLSTLLVASTLSACNAFAEAANGDGGTAEPTLSIDPASLGRGRSNDFTIKFTVDPPWINEPVDKAYPTDFDPGPGIGYQFTYDGLLTWTARLTGSADAEIGLHRITVAAAYERKGKPQWTHEGWGLIYIHLGTSSADGGVDGGQE